MRVRDSVLINVTLTGKGVVEGSVLIGTRAKHIRAERGFDVLSTVLDLRLDPRGGSYKVVSTEPVQVGLGERVTTLFLPSLGKQQFRVQEDTDLKAQAQSYSVPILGNPISFQAAHREMGGVPVELLEQSRREAESVVLAAL